MEISRIVFDHVAGFYTINVHIPRLKFLKKKKNLFAYLFLPALGLVAACSLSLVAASRGYSSCGVQASH